jgi:hypothetical protein
MAHFPLTQRLAGPRVGDSRPWDDPAVQRTTGQVQQIMRRDYPTCSRRPTLPGRPRRRCWPAFRRSSPGM